MSLSLFGVGQNSISGILGGQPAGTVYAFNLNGGVATGFNDNPPTLAGSYTWNTSTKPNSSWVSCPRGSNNSFQVFYNNLAKYMAGSSEDLCWEMLFTYSGGSAYIGEMTLSGQFYSPLRIQTGTNRLNAYRNNGTVGWQFSNQPVNLSAGSSGWIHLAITKSGSVMQWYINGVYDAGSSYTLPHPLGNPSFSAHYLMSLGGTHSVAKARLIMGQTYYTSNFTPDLNPYQL